MRKNWHWIELIGFDNTAEDLGVSAFLSRLAEAPEGISLLFSHIDIINTFVPSYVEYGLRPCDCSYSGHRYSTERERQEWTSFQLKRLIERLHENGVKVIFSIFNFTAYTSDNGERITTEFAALHTELLGVRKNGESRENSIHILKKMKDGSFYEDYFLSKLKSFIDYYGFDGVQVADGISSARPSVQNGDFSDDTVLQFCDWLRKNDREVPPILSVDGGVPVLYRRRRKHIIENMLFDFLCFSSDRWRGFYDKLYGVIDPERYIIFINSFWTRDPFEAFYRYGIDYRYAFRKGVYALMVEENSATYPTFSVESRGGFYLPLEKSRYVHYEYYLMQMLLKAYVPEFRQIPLLPIGDTQEDWNAVHDASNELKRAVFRRNNSRVYINGEWLPCAEAPFYCLSDGVSRDDWAKLAAWDSKKALDGLIRPLGYALYYPDNIEGEVKRYIDTKNMGVHRLACELLSNGVQISSVLSARDAQKYKYPIIALLPEYYSKTELEALMSSKAPTVFISYERSYGDTVYEGQVFVSVRNLVAAVSDETVSAIRKAEGIKKCSSSNYDPQGGIWTAPLKYNEWKKAFTMRLSQMLCSFIPMPRVKAGQSYECKLTAFELTDNRMVLLVSNDDYCNIVAQIELGGKTPISASSLTKYKGYKIPLDGKTVRVPVAPRSMEMVELRFE